MAGDKTFNILTQLSLNSADFKSGLDAVKGNVKDLMMGVEGANGNLGEMRKALMALKNISFAGKSVEEIQAINTQIGRLVDQMADARSVQNALGQELGTVLAGGLETASAAVEVFVGVTSMFGLSKESAEKLQQKMVTLIGVTQALGVIEDALANHQIQNIALRVQTTVVTGIAAVALWAHTTATAANAAATAAATVITSNASLASKAAAAAQWLWNAAILANPIGAIIIAVAALTAGIYLLVRAHSKENDELERKQKLYEKARVEQDITEKNNQLEIDKSKLRGATKQQLIETELSQIKDKISKNNELIASNRLLENNEKNYNDRIKLINDGQQLAADLQKKEIELINVKKDAYGKLTEQLGILEARRKNEIILTGIVLKATADEIKLIKDKLKLTEEVTAKSPYEQLTSKISEMEKKIKDVVATGGVVTPKMKEDLRLAKKQLEDINKQVDILIGSKIEPMVMKSKVPVVSPIPKPQIHEFVKPNFKVYENAIEWTANFEMKMAKDVTRFKKSMYLQDVLAAQEALRKKEIDEVEYNNKIKSLDKETNNYKLSVAAQAAGDMSSLFSEQTVAYKALAIAQIGIATTVAAIAALQPPPIGYGPLLGPWAAGGIILGGVVAAAKVMGFEMGGIVPGSNYSNDKVPIMANSGERILTAAQNSNFTTFLNAGTLNSSFNGREVIFKIQGTELVGVLNNQSRKINSIR